MHQGRVNAPLATVGRKRAGHRRPCLLLAGAPEGPAGCAWHAARQTLLLCWTALGVVRHSGVGTTAAEGHKLLGRDRW